MSLSRAFNKVVFRQLLHNNVAGESTPDLTQSVQMRIKCYADAAESSDTLNMHTVATSIATCVKATPIKSIPVISTALAKNLASAHTHFRDEWKTG